MDFVESALSKLQAGIQPAKVLLVGDQKRQGLGDDHDARGGHLVELRRANNLMNAGLQFQPCEKQ
jgi:hypothetical protein